MFSVKISFDKYRTVHPMLQEDLDQEDMSQEVEEIKDKKGKFSELLHWSFW